MTVKEKVLKIEWQRLVEGGETCLRCGSTEKELVKAVSMLEAKGFKSILKKSKLSLKEFKKAPLESNRIRINGRTLESWLGAKTGSSRCCEACGGSKCRTTVICSKAYESISAELIVRAGLKAAKQSI
jgi:hypothetical protein